MNRIKLLAVLLFISAGFSNATDFSSEISIPYTKYVLDNGLTLIVHEDHKAPIVAVNIWYHVGSKNEKPGKTGFAHLFEHLMFNGSENFNDDYFQALESIGATDLNGTTNADRTNYFQNVPVSALDRVLWLESDRMGHMVGAISQEKLDEQRGVVQNEKRQGENRPYGMVRQLTTENTYPAGHPYSWTTIGSMEDLDAASLEDVHEWFNNNYGAANAVLVIAGDVEAEAVKEKVERYFGDIPSGPPMTHHQTWISKREGTHRQITRDRVPQARIMKIWNIPEWGSKEAEYLNLASDVLALGKTSRLYKRLVYEEQLATNAFAYVQLREIGGQFTIDITAKPGADLKEIEKVADEELQKFLENGPTEKEMTRIKTQYFAGFVRGIERIGGFGGKSDILAMNEVYKGDPEFYKQTLRTIEETTATDIQSTASKWLSDGVYILEIHPFAEYTTKETDVDRSKLPDLDDPSPVTFPDIQKAQLSNGLNIILAERHSIPVVDMNLVLDAGFAADQMAKPGTARLAMDMLDEGTKNRTSLEISEELAMLGAELQSASDLDASMVFLSAMKSNIDPSLELFADVILNPAFSEEDFSRKQKDLLARIQQEKASPVQIALRLFPELLYGEGHAYGNPYTGSGTEASIQSMTVDDLKKFHKSWFKPNNATLLVVGDITLDELKPKLESLFDKWKKGDVPEKNIGEVALNDKSSVYIIHRDGAEQSIILGGHLAPPKSNPDEEAIQMLNNILGGDFTSRVNLNLREDKHWTYGARTLLLPAKGQRPFIAYAPVQTDKTSESIGEIKKELSDIISSRPPTEAEFIKTKENQILSLPGTWETNEAVSGSLEEMVRFGLDDDYFHNYAELLRGMTLTQVQEAAKILAHPDKMVWVVIGDREQIEESIREADIGEVHFMNADGEIVE